MRGFFSEMQKTIVRLPVFGVVCAALILNACLCYTKAADDVIENGAYKKANAYLMQCGDSVRSEFLAVLCFGADETIHVPFHKPPWKSPDKTTRQVQWHPSPEIPSPVKTHRC